MSFSPENKTNSLEVQDHSDPASKIAATKAMIKKLEGMIQMATTAGKPEIAAELEFRKASNEATLQSLQQEADLGDLDFTSPVEKTIATKQPTTLDVDGGAYDNAPGVADGDRISARERKYDLGKGAGV
jgi:hypothetical protein